MLTTSLKIGAKGSKIIATIRSDDIASMIRALAIQPLKRLLEDECWSILKSKAFGNGGAEETPNMVATGKKIVKKCGGVPLTAKTLGDLMHIKKDEQEWSSTSSESETTVHPKQALGIHDFHSVAALPEWLGNLSSLRKLGLYVCNNLMYLPKEEGLRGFTALQCNLAVLLSVCGPSSVTPRLILTTAILPLIPIRPVPITTSMIHILIDSVFCTYRIARVGSVVCRFTGEKLSESIIVMEVAVCYGFDSGTIPGCFTTDYGVLGSVPLSWIRLLNAEGWVTLNLIALW
ncbi:hypothetical protein NE237_004172 [Protea cynaroides]|uniref:NB-ARC domain-containing protein n=1 Tax=Protea cynaroides TaxID=273540 RepID=A0A9Q0KI62_9MAGN|nr:hypothetical protein NE237_004172 [Protea cynaroides]